MGCGLSTTPLGCKQMNIYSINNISDTISFSAKNQALFLIYNRFQSKPFKLIDPDPGTLGSTVWVFK